MLYFAPRSTAHVVRLACRRELTLFARAEGEFVHTGEKGYHTEEKSVPGIKKLYPQRPGYENDPGYKNVPGYENVPPPGTILYDRDTDLSLGTPLKTA